MTNAGPHQAVFDDQHRPITAGGFAKAGPLVFADVTKKAGLSTWRNVTGSPDKRVIIEAKGSGVCLIDYDNDGWLDIYLVNGSTLDARAGHAAPPHAALFHNNHDGTFTDVTASAGVANDRWGTGCVVGDFDNNGSPDLYVTNVGPNRLYRNNRDGTFTDIAVKAGVALEDESSPGAIDHTGATFGDYDGDGNLDLFVAGYIELDLKNASEPGSKASGYDFCQYRGVKVMCGPRGLQGAGDHLFHSNGDGTFTDVGKKMGIEDPNGYYGLDALFVDVNNDGKPDLMVANDSTPNYLYINKGNGTFKDESYEDGFALNGDGREAANMGLAVGDYENNGHLAVASTTFSDDYPILFRNNGTGAFTDVSYQAGIAQSSIPFVKFGDGFLDYDNDGWKDLLVAQGHDLDTIERINPQFHYREPMLLARNTSHKFVDVSSVSGDIFQQAWVGRGMAIGDIDNDGRIDAVVTTNGGPARVLLNKTENSGHWITLRLIGHKSNRDGIGAVVEIEIKTSRGRQWATVTTSSGYLSASDPRIHFGLGGKPYSSMR